MKDLRQFAHLVILTAAGVLVLRRAGSHLVLGFC